MGYAYLAAIAVLLLTVDVCVRVEARGRLADHVPRARAMDAVREACTRPRER